METSAPIQLLSGALLTVCVTVLLSRSALLAWLGAGSGGSAGGVSLRSAELAYLVRDGDMPHVLSVIAVDLIQRYLKSGAPAEAAAELAPYEKEIQASVVDFVKSWARCQVNQVLPAGKPLNLVQWLAGVSRIRQLIMRRIAPAVAAVLKDPRHLRQYFSAGGVARLVFDLYSSGLRENVERSLVEELGCRGLVVPQSRRRQCASLMALAFWLALGASGLAAWCLTGSILLAGAIALIAGITACFLKVLTLIPGFVPWYEEMSSIIIDLNRQGFRFALLRRLVGLARLFGRLALALAGTTGIAAGAAACHLAFGIAWVPALALLAASTACAFALVQLLADRHRLIWREYPSAHAAAAVRAARAALASASPLEAFRRVLVEGEYDQSFSDIVAIYGIDTLWLLS